MAEKVEAVRNHKRARSLARQCTSQLRRLVEIAGFEHFLAEAVREFERTGTAPVNTLLRRLDALVMELDSTHEEHRQMRSDRVLGGRTLAEVIGECIS
ncbi:hypothetical protein [Variovorax sp. SRS16]|uniref:hypothetical protein n=1 Tax=Variovorax sp. SRS16 TaxID=282217 RepID=UPI0013A57A41|nr:hypothetical protein [Variovorax sp. SRS16]